MKGQKKMTEADFTGMDAGEYYAMKDFEASELRGQWNKEKNKSRRETNLRKKKGRNYDNHKHDRKFRGDDYDDYGEW